jgi:DNA-binding NtrC family response regulator
MVEMQPAAHLLVVAPGAAPRTLRLDAPVITIGSDASCDLRLDDAEPVHAELRWQDARVEVVRRGTVLWINGRRVRQHWLVADDLIVIGRTALMFRWGSAAEQPGTIPAATLTCERLYAIARRVRSDDAPVSIRRQLLEDVCALTGADTACCAWLDATGAPSTLEAFPAGATPPELALSSTIIARVLDTRRAILWLDGAGADLLDCASSLADASIRSVLAVPVWVGERLTAILYASTRRATAFSAQTLDLITLFASLAQHLLVAEAERSALEERARAARDQLEAVRRNALVGTSAVMRQLDRDVTRIAGSNLSVLVVGETGTGKELVARQLHERGGRPDGPFVAVNCGAIPEELVEATLFGHVKGAFTGSHADHDGLIRAAHGGTLFLDEIAELPLSQQSKLLRVLETREVLPVGGARPQVADFRLVSATLRPLNDAEQRSQHLRDDLFFRIAGVTLRIPPLRERDDDVLTLAEHFLRRQRAQLGRPGLRLSAAARARMQSHDWPGNVRELEVAITRACSVAETDTLEPADLELPPQSGREPVLPLSVARDHFQKRYVLEVVERLGGNRSAAAAALGVTARTIYKYIEET